MAATGGSKLAARATLTVGATLTAALAAGLTLRRKYLLVTVTGHSMLPTCTAGDRLLVRRTGISALRTGAIVVFHSPDIQSAQMTEHLAAHPETETVRYTVPDTRLLIKRVAATPGDQLPTELATPGNETVPPGSIAVLGDNPAVSYDSRTYGYIPEQLIVGVAIRRFTRA